MVEVKYTVVENRLNKLYASGKTYAYEKLKAKLLSNRFIIETRDIAWMRSHLVCKQDTEVIERNERGIPIRWRSHQYLTEEELFYLTDQLKVFY